VASVSALMAFERSSNLMPGYTNSAAEQSRQTPRLTILAIPSAVARVQRTVHRKNVHRPI
jgi:hypothetical protein